MVPHDDFFEVYIKIINEAFGKVRRIGFKRFAIIKDLLESLESMRIVM